LLALREVQRGGSAERIFNRALRRAVEGAQRRFAPKSVERAIAELAVIDRVVKGVAVGDGWSAFLALGLKLADGSKG
jgi:hypothetical protein